MVEFFPQKEWFKWSNWLNLIFISFTISTVLVNVFYFFQDELDDVSVKQGFTHRPQIQDEYSSAKSTSITPAKVCRSL